MYKSLNFYKFIQEISFKLDHTFSYDKNMDKLYLILEFQIFKYNKKWTEAYLLRIVFQTQRLIIPFKTIQIMLHNMLL